MKKCWIYCSTKKIQKSKKIPLKKKIAARISRFVLPIYDLMSKDTMSVKVSADSEQQTYIKGTRQTILEQKESGIIWKAKTIYSYTVCLNL